MSSTHSLCITEISTKSGYTDITVKLIHGNISHNHSQNFWREHGYRGARNRYHSAYPSAMSQSHYNVEEKIMGITWGIYYWPIWIVVTALLFLPTEIFAVITNPANTLSEYCWHELNVTQALTFSAHGMAWWISLIMWGFFVVAITLHIWYASW
jgi:hypothetical protein